MIVLIIVSIALPVCLVMVIFTCLNCFQKPKFQNFQNRQSDRAHNNPSFTVDITDSQGNEQVAIEPLPDILAKTTTATPSRPKIICSERGKQDATLSLISVHRSFPREQLQYLNEVESGWFGKVLDTEATKIVSGSEKSRVMVKMLKDDASKAEQKQFLDEVLAFRCLQHANVLGLLGQCIETTPFLILLEFAPHGNLKTFLTERRLEVEAMLKRHMFLGFAVDAAAGLACLHRHGYVHNDVAARNCLVMADYTVKIGDYGISEVFFKEDYMMSGSDLLPIRWMAPESLVQSQGVWTAQPGDKVSDMWSFGVLLWEIFSFGERPYDMLTDEAMLQGVVVDKIIKPAELDTRLEDRDQLWQLLNQCWQDPAQRIEIEQLHQQLDHLTSARRDTFEVSIDFDQRWRDLQPNKRASSIDSRIPLAGSFAGSTATESSVASVGTEIVSDFTSSTDSKAEPVIENSPAQSAQVLNGSGDRNKEITGPMEFESSKSEGLGSGDGETTNPTKKYDDPVIGFESEKKDVTPFKPVAVASSTPVGSKQDDTSEFLSPLTSTPASLYSTAVEASEPSGIDPKDNSTLESLSDDAELTFVKPETKEADDSKNASKDFSDYVRTSPIAQTLDFGDFESSQHANDPDISSDKATIPEIGADFSEFESANSEFSIVERNDITADQSQVLKTDKSNLEEEETPQNLSLHFESMNMDSFAEEKDIISPVTAETELQGLESPGLLTSAAVQTSESEPVEELQAKQGTNSGPLLDEDVDQLVPSSNEAVQDLLGSMLVPSLPSEPGLLLPVETVAEPTIQPMALAEMLEQQQPLAQNLEGMPAHDPQAMETSKESLIAALGESLESQPKSEEPSGNLLDDPVTPDSSSFEKVGTAREFPSHAVVHCLDDVTQEKRLKPELAFYVSKTNSYSIADVPLENSFNAGPDAQTLHDVHTSSNDSSVQHRDFTDHTDQHVLDMTRLSNGTSSNTHEREELLDPYHHPLPHMIINKDVNLLNNKWNLQNGDQLITCDNNTALFSQHQKAMESELLSPDDDTTADSGIHSGKQEHFSDSADEDESDELGTDHTNIGYTRTESPLNTVSPADSDSDVSSSSSTSTSGSSGGEYSCDTGHQRSTPSIDTGQRKGTPLDTGQSHHQKASIHDLGPKSVVESEPEILEMITDFYLSKGVKSPRTFEMRPLETIVEDQVLSSPAWYRENSITTPSDTSSLDVKYEDLFGSDGFEWDDLCGDSVTTDIQTSLEPEASSGPQDNTSRTNVEDLPISSTRQALNQILSRTGLLNRTSPTSESSHRQFNSDTMSLSPSNSPVTSSSFQTGSSSVSQPHYGRRLGAEINTSLYSLAEDYSFDSDSLSEACDLSSVHSFDHDEPEDSKHDTSNSPGSHSPSITPSSLLSSELASMSLKISSGNVCDTDSLLPSHLGKEIKLSHADEVSDTSMADWDLLGQEASSTPNTDTAKTNSSSAEPSQATLIDL